MEWDKIKMLLGILKQLLCSFSRLDSGNFQTSNCLTMQASHSSQLFNWVSHQSKNIRLWITGHMISLKDQDQLSHCYCGFSFTLSIWSSHLLMTNWAVISSANNLKPFKKCFPLTQITCQKNKEIGLNKNSQVIKRDLV